MQFVCKPKSLIRIYRLTSVPLSKCYYSQTQHDKWPDLAEICRTGKAPEHFNFASHVFEKQVVQQPNHTALWFDNGKEERKWSYSQVRTESIRSALAIKSLLNPQSELSTALNNPPIILSILPRVPEWWFLYLGSIRLGTVFCPGTIQLTAEDIKFRLEASRAQIVITDPSNQVKVEEAYSLVDKSKKGCEFLKKVVVESPGDKEVPKLNDWISYKSLVSDISDNDILLFRDTKTKGDDLAQVFFTSGTTGSPKMVAHPHTSYGIGHFKTAQVMDLKETDVIWAPCDTGWALQSYCGFFSPWIVGLTSYVHQMPKFEPQTILEVLQSKPITVFATPPTLYKSILQVKDEKLFQFSTLRRCIAAGEAINPETVRLWEEKTGLTITSIYGQTEMCGMGGPAPQKMYSFGNPSDQYDLRIISKSGEECPPSKEGQIVVKIKPVRPIGFLSGYLIEGPEGPEWDEEKHKSCFVGDYYLTGDRGYRDEEGNFYFASRSDDVINSAGYRIGPFEVESVIQTHPAVVECAVVASPDTKRGEVVKAFIVLTDKVKYSKALDKRKLAKDIQEHVKQHTAPYKYPRKVEFVDSLPKTISGKILRRELKKLEFS